MIQQEKCILDSEWHNTFTLSLLIDAFGSGCWIKRWTNLSWRKANEHLRYTYRNTKIKQGKFCLRYHFRVKDKYSNWNCYSVDYFIEKLNIFTWLNSCSIWFMLGGKIKRTVYTWYKQLQRLFFRCKATFLFSVTLNWIWQCSVLCWTDRMVWKLRTFW